MTSSPFLPLPDGLDIEEVSVEEEGLMISVVARASSSACPLCSHPATRIHSRYLRTLADVPCGGRRVVLSLLVRKFFCQVASCRRRIFTERLPQLVQPWARLTNRLCEWQERIGFATNGEVGARLAPDLGMQLAPTTLLRRLMAHPVEHPQAVLRLGIDDFAFRRGKKYGTILVDLDTHRVIDLLQDRTAQGAAAWLSTHPELEVISRDRGTDYAAAARQAAPQALQVADRFHLVKNLVESVEVVLARCRAEVRKAYQLPPPLPAKTVPSAEDVSPTPEIWRRVPPPHIARVQQARRAQRMDRYEQLVQLRASGLAPKEIAQQMGLSQRTMRRWLAQETFPEAKQRRKKHSPFDAYAPYVIKRWQEGCHNGVQLWRELQTQGYHHAPNMLYQFLKTLRASELPVLAQGEAHLETTPKKATVVTLANVAPPELADFLARKAVWLFVRDLASLDESEQQELELIRQGSATANTTYQLAQEFVHMVRHQGGHDLPLWLSKVADSQIPELQSFASGIERDKDAVVAGLTLPFNNGLVEGQVNRLKLIKRMMYGRASFPLLRQRVLHAA